MGCLEPSLNQWAEGGPSPLVATGNEGHHGLVAEPLKVQRVTTLKRAYKMAGKADQMKGKAKEAIGDLSGNKDLKAEGRADRHAGEVKHKVGNVEQKVDEAIDKVKGVLHKK